MDYAFRLCIAAASSPCSARIPTCCPRPPPQRQQMLLVVVVLVVVRTILERIINYSSYSYSLGSSYRYYYYVFSKYV